MLDPQIKGFLDERKEGWLKKKITGNLSEEKISEINDQAEQEYTIPGWLPSAAKRAKQLSMVSHPAKFTHPGAQTTSIIAEAERATDGFVRTGNTEVALDVFGNAAALDVHKFLTLQLVDGKSILTHLEENTQVIKDQLDVCSEAYDEIRNGLLAIKQTEGSSEKTSDKVKQVYFPIEEGEYHLLSILTPSGMMFELKDRIRNMHFSDETKEAREAKKSGKLHESGFSEVYGLSMIGFGGTKPQNISVLNNNRGGTAYLLSSTPPSLSDRKVQPPRTDFFRDSLWLKPFADDFQKFHNLLSQDRNNIHVRRKRDWLIRSIIYQVADRLWMIRSLASGWSESDNYQNLPAYQKTWLDQLHQNTREERTDLFSSVRKELARWFLKSYRTELGKKALSLADDELPHIRTIIDECEEALK